VAIEYDAAQARGEVARASLIFMIERDPDYIVETIIVGNRVVS